MAQLLIASGFIPTQQSQDHFFDNVDQKTGRSFTAVPVFPQVGFDQQCEISSYYILKGNQHGTDGANTLQLHTVVNNKQGGGFDLHPPFLFYNVWMCTC